MRSDRVTFFHEGRQVSLTYLLPVHDIVEAFASLAGVLLRLIEANKDAVEETGVISTGSASLLPPSSLSVQSLAAFGAKLEVRRNNNTRAAGSELAILSNVFVSG